MRAGTADDLEGLVQLRAVVLRDDLERLGRYELAPAGPLVGGAAPCLTSGTGRASTAEAPASTTIAVVLEGGDGLAQRERPALALGVPVPVA